ncbi:MAG: pitrilysin family protein [Candidatus Microgenomates bacterium]
MKINNFTLKNGLRVLLVDTEAFPTLTTLLLVGAGSRYETEKNNGIAHFFEHMAFKGSKKYSSSLIISSIIEGKGGIFNAFTAKDHTGYWIKSTVDHFETVVDVLSDMVLYPLLKEEEIEREKGVIVEEINMYEDTPYRKVGDYFENLLYQGNSLGLEIAGTKETVTSFNRATFVDYINSLYYPKNAVLVVAGGLSKFNQARYRVSHSSGSPFPAKGGKDIPSRSKQVSSLYDDYLSIIEEKFGSWQGDKKINFQKVKENQNKPQIFVKYKDTQQAHFVLGYRAFSLFDKRRYALSVLSSILGGGMSSRLFIEVRERRGLCYYVHTSKEAYQDVGYIATSAGVVNNLEKIKEAVEVIIDEHEKIASGDLKDEEIEKAKEYLKGRVLLSLEDSTNIATSFGTSLVLTNQFKTVEQVIEEIEKVKRQDLIALAKELFVKKHLNFALIGPFKEKEFENIF